MTAHTAVRGFRLKPRHCTFATFLVCLAIIPICDSYPTFVWPLEMVAKNASVLATVKVGPVSPPGTQGESVYRTGSWSRRAGGAKEFPAVGDEGRRTHPSGLPDTRGWKFRYYIDAHK